MEPRLDKRVVHDPFQELPIALADADPKVLAPTSGGNMLFGKWKQRCRLLVPQDRLGHLAVAGGASAFFRRILMDRKTWRVDPQLDELSDANVPFQNRVRNLKSLAVF